MARSKDERTSEVRSTRADSHRKKRKSKATVRKCKIREPESKTQHSSGAPISSSPVLVRSKETVTTTSVYDTVGPQKRFSKTKAMQVKPFVDATLSKGVGKLVADFKKMKRFNDYTKMAEFVSQNTFNRNRYKDVGCLDESRVILTKGPVSYIHANYASTPLNPKRFICTQAPLPTTCTEFWYMIVQEKAVTILMLCNFFEMGTNKCAAYFPQTPDCPALDFDNGNLRVVNKSQEQHNFDIKTKVKVSVSRIEVTLSGQPPHLCTHYHWMDWPDRGVPPADLAPISLLNAVQEPGSSAPIVVHCSAGIGRTGSIVLLQHALDILQSGSQLGPISTYLEELRKQRNNSVQTEHQYLYVHQVLLLYLKRNGYLDSSIQPHLDAFTKDYVKTTT